MSIGDGADRGCFWMASEPSVSRARELTAHPERLTALLEKYRLLEALRRGEPGRTIARRDAMRAIADRFPAAMREWDEAPLREIERRRGEVERVLAALAKDGGDAAQALLSSPERAFIGYASDLHERLRAALQVKRWLAGRALTDELARDALSRFQIDRPRLEAIAAPANGRVTEAVFREVAELHGVSVAAVKAALFPVHPG